ncbi:MAG: MoxR family ATPase [Nanoarchaeota archaeon]
MKKNKEKVINKKRIDTKTKKTNSEETKKFKGQTPTQEGDYGGRATEEEVATCGKKLQEVKNEIKKVVVGQEKVVEGLIRGLLCNGHVLLEGVPGIAKTLLVITLAKVTGCEAKRVQFTVDLLPTDIVGITTYTPDKGMEVVKGPIFANFLVADEINRSPPKTQSALLEAMQERNVTIGKETYPLPKPFFVMATENPVETSGVYFLPEAQVDRFLFKILMDYPSKDEEKVIMKRNMSLFKFEDFEIKPILTPEEIVRMQILVKDIYLSKEIEEYIVRIVEATRDNQATEYNQFLEMGCSPRATIGLFIASKAEALINGRNFVIPSDVRKVAFEILRHRMILNYLAQSEKVTPEKVIQAILDKVEIP